MKIKQVRPAVADPLEKLEATVAPVLGLSLATSIGSFGYPNGSTALDDLQEYSADLEERAVLRQQQQELRRQNNIDAILALAREFLPRYVEEEPVDVDWLARFIQYCQDVSDRESQEIWGKILARETGKPGSFTLATLHHLSLLSSTDLYRFGKLCGYLWHIQGRSGLLADEQTENDLLRYGNIDPGESFFKNGLVSNYPDLRLRFSAGQYHSLEYDDRTVRLINQQSRKKPDIAIYPLSSFGEILYGLIDVDPDENYFEHCLSQWRSAGFQVSVS
ncbi:MAG: DUF2806 domain-containing protein [Chloroflexi bacterium]|nr:DUF2806 domain-containing protein [Chloroflexota bacterium]